MIFDYITLKIIWYVLMLTLLAGVLITCGMDFGVLASLKIVAKTDDERRHVINSIGPTWDGNQVWLITLIGACFAAWPIVYATVFSCFYYLMFLLLFSLIIRPPGIDYRSKIECAYWRSMWDHVLSVSGVLPPLLLGIFFAKIFTGGNFTFTELSLPFATEVKGDYLLLYFGFMALTLSAFMMQGLLFLCIKTHDSVVERANMLAKKILFLYLLTFIVLFIYINFYMQGYLYNNSQGFHLGQWSQNFTSNKNLFSIPLLAISFIIIAANRLWQNRYLGAIYAFSLSMISVMLTFAAISFPFILPSEYIVNSSLTIWNATSSHKALMTLFYVVIILLPIVLTYTVWSYLVVKGKTKELLY